MTEDEMRRHLADRLGRAVHDANERLFLGAVTTSTREPSMPTLTPERLRSMMDECRRIERHRRRNDFTVVVVQGQQGDVLMERHPTDGTFAEMSIDQAQAMHAKVPLVPLKVISPDRAHFRPARSFDRYVPKFLPRPPYEMPEEPSPLS